MKKFLALFLALVMVFALAACNGGNNGGKEPDDGGKETGEKTAAELVSEAFIDPLADWSKYDDLIAQVKAETNFENRVKLMHEAEDILMSTGCVIPVYYYNDIYMQKPYVSGIYSNPFGTKFFMFAKLDNGSDTLRLQLSSEPAYTDPALNSSVDGACLAANSFSGLYTYNEEGKTSPACAESYTASEDGLTYTVKLKEGLKWSDGSDLTAADFEYSWKRAAAEETAADYGYMFSGFEGYPDINVKAVDNTTLEFVLSAPCAYIEDLMAFPTFFPVKQSAVEANADYATNPGGWCTEAGFVSNGAYTCTAWDHDVSMTYTKNPYWYDADKVTVEKLEYMLSADDTAIYAAYNAGNIDFCDTVPTDEIASLLEAKNPEFHIVDELGTYYVAFNAKSSIFEGKTPEEAAVMRLAFSLLIDRDYICDNIGQTGQVPANAFIPLGMADGNGGIFKETAEDGYFDATAINTDHDATVELARTYLKAAGFEFGDDGKLKEPLALTYITNPTSGHIAIAEAIQQDLSEIGIELTIEQQEWAVFLEERKQGHFDFAREGWVADFNDPINMLEMWTTDSGNNDCQFGR